MTSRTIVITAMAAWSTKGVRDAVAVDPALAHGVNTVGGHVTNPAVAEALGVDCVQPSAALAT